MPLAFIHLPATPRHQVHVGKVFVREEAHQKHVWRPRGHPGPKIWDLSDPAQIADFNAAVSAVCVKQPGVHQIPVPFVFEAPAATPATPPRIDPPAGSKQPPQPPAANPEPAKWGLLQHDKKKYFFVRRNSQGVILYRGREDIWSESVPEDPFTNKKAARKSVPKGTKLIEPLPSSE